MDSRVLFSRSHTMASQAQLQQLQHDFACFADPQLRPGQGTITVRDLCTLVRASGKNPSQAEMQKIIAHVDQSCEGCVDFQTFLKVLKMPMTPLESEADLANAFRAFDKESNGLVSESELQTVMRTFGEPLNDEEVDMLMTAAGPFKDGKGNIKYQGFVKFMQQSR